MIVCVILCSVVCMYDIRCVCMCVCDGSMVFVCVCACACATIMVIWYECFSFHVRALYECVLLVERVLLSRVFQS